MLKYSRIIARFGRKIPPENKRGNACRSTVPVAQFGLAERKERPMYRIKIVAEGGREFLVGLEAVASPDSPTCCDTRAVWVGMFRDTGTFIEKHDPATRTVEEYGRSVLVVFSEAQVALAWQKAASIKVGDFGPKLLAHTRTLERFAENGWCRTGDIPEMPEHRPTASAIIHGSMKLAAAAHRARTHRTART